MSGAHASPAVKHPIYHRIHVSAKQISTFLSSIRITADHTLWKQSISLHRVKLQQSIMLGMSPRCLMTSEIAMIKQRELHSFTLLN